jgi:hypothetical protein
MKCHCAPIRDRVVEKMVRVVEEGWEWEKDRRVMNVEEEGGDLGTSVSANERRPMRRKEGAVKGLKMCFDILELMKLVSIYVPSRPPLPLVSVSSFANKVTQRGWRGIAY